MKALTSTHIDVLDRLSLGQTKVEVAATTNRSLYTIQDHAKAIRARLEAETMAHAVRIAFERKILPLKCPLCKRPLGKTVTDHHLIPRAFNGKELVRLHPICEQKIHSVFTERELANYYNTIERILENEHIQAFVRWVARKPPDFYEKSKDESGRKRKRGRR